MNSLSLGSKIPIERAQWFIRCDDQQLRAVEVAAQHVDPATGLKSQRIKRRAKVNAEREKSQGEEKANGERGKAKAGRRRYRSKSGFPL
jgi:hypothetical protein